MSFNSEIVVGITGTLFQCLTAGFVAWLSYKMTKLGHAIESQAVEAHRAQIDITKTMADIESQQLRASLFDRRLALYETINKAGSLGNLGDGPTDDELRAFYAAANSFKYWFGEEAGKHAVKMGIELHELNHLKRAIKGNMVETPQVTERIHALSYWLQLPRREELDRLVLPQLMIYQQSHTADPHVPSTGA